MTVDGLLGGGLTEAAEVSRLTKALLRSSPGKPQHERFRDLCAVVLKTYSEHGWDLGSIKENPATGPLVRYFLFAALRYAKAEPATLGTDDRADELAMAFGLVSGGAQGKIMRGWEEDDQLRCFDAFRVAYNAAIDDEKSREQAWRLGFSAAKKELRKGRGEASGQQRKLEGERVRALLRRLQIPEPE